MSSEGSVSTSTSSRIRQFGLYRSIDQRTEEFLKLSRKRQIKQGCACAAISTAITVTVVITVFLIYMEYGMNTESNQPSLGKSAWIGILNDSLATSFEDKFGKNKMIFDHTTIKLLPIIIKALKQNRFLEKILDDYSSSSPAYEGKVTTEFTFKKDIFINTKSWMKKPTSRLYTIEYKTSPIVFVKNRAKDIGYFTKNRKIREYKRMMEYFKKMIKYKVGTSAANQEQFPRIEFETQNPEHTKTKKFHSIINRPSKVKPKKDRKITKSVNKNKNALTQNDNFVSCNCPRYLSLLLNKIFSSIQQLIPDSLSTNLKPCNGKQNNTHTSVNFISITKAKKENKTKNSATLSDRFNINKKSFTAATKFSKFDNIFRKHVITTERTFFKQSHSEKIYSSNNLVNIIPTTTASFHAEATEVIARNNFATSPMNIVDTIDNKSYVITTTEKKTLEGNNINPTYSVPQSSKNTDIGESNEIINLNTYRVATFDMPEATDSPTFDPMETIHLNKKQDELSTTTVKILINKSNNFNIHSNAPFKSNIASPSNRSQILSEIKTGLINKTSDLRKNVLNKSVQAGKSYGNSNFQQNTEYEEFNMKEILSSGTNTDLDIISPVINYEKVSLGAKSNINKMRHKIALEKDKKRIQPFLIGLDNAALEEEIEKITHEDDYQQEELMKTPTNYNIYQKTNATTATKNQNIKTESAEYGNVWKKLKHTDKFTSQNSMLPNSRPTYLEIHRNNWKHDETNDYDTNMKYNTFDLL